MAICNNTRATCRGIFPQFPAIKWRAVFHLHFRTLGMSAFRQCWRTSRTRVYLSHRWIRSKGHSRGLQLLVAGRDRPRASSGRANSGRRICLEIVILRITTRPPYDCRKTCQQSFLVPHMLLCRTQSSIDGSGEGGWTDWILQYSHDAHHRWEGPLVWYHGAL
jgi:hypothetical protein